jgi:hypothetical protein
MYQKAGLEMECECRDWCRTDGLDEDHHPNCKTKIYFEVRDSDNGPVLTVDIDEVKAIIDSMGENCKDGNQECYKFEPVELSEYQFKNLPEFQGF